MSVKVGKSEEGLHVFNFSRFWPILYDVDFLGIHCKSGWRQNVSEVFDCLFVEGAFIGVCV